MFSSSIRIQSFAPPPTPFAPERGPTMSAFVSPWNDEGNTATLGEIPIPPACAAPATKVIEAHG